MLINFLSVLSMLHFLECIMKGILFLSVFFINWNAKAFDPTTHPNWQLLDNDICGHVSSDRIIGGQEAPMNAYPWLVRIGYTATNEPGIVFFRCGGIIVNPQTVVTAAHCVAVLPPRQEIHTIRFGEHDTETDPDCVGDFCSDPVVDIEPAEILVPKSYNKIPFKHDIAIIRLKKKVRYTASVKPICLMGGKIYNKTLVGRYGEVAGWGIYDISKSLQSTVLQVVKLPIVNNSVCIKHFPKFTKIGNTQLCVGGEVGKDSCAGDSGGPVMMVDDSSGKPRYYALGVVSFGAKKCGATTAPGVYTKISAYMKWILDNLIQTTNSAKIVNL